eukprot:TRINITY_DN4286_c0_g1_i2.p1 TRINITY_DN4286_c0_g1~~TRINITY_DN4286_c0_g1_i2.p1  ORF type:complete len:132 (-),score=24.49 TRINITY_DN4286_c0_g1_i2:93-488(-)
MTYVLKMRRSVKGGGQEIYTLNDNGKQTKYGKSAPKINMSFYWDSMGPTIDSIIGAKEEGWDQIRIYYDMTSQPIYYIDVLAQDGRNRSFSIYGTPYEGAKLQDSNDPLPEMYINLYKFMAEVEANSCVIF